MKIFVTLAVLLIASAAAGEDDTGVNGRKIIKRPMLKISKVSQFVCCVYVCDKILK